jgi:HTH-type transcriptional regulator / antitoxin HigA
MLTSARFNRRRLPRTFDGLSRLRPLQVIQDEADYNTVRALADALILMPDPTEGQEKYLQTLLLIMEAWENEHDPIQQPMSPLEALRFLLEHNSMSASDLGRLLGNRALGAAILRGERGLSKTHIGILADRFKVNPGLFLERTAAGRRRSSA